MCRSDSHAKTLNVYTNFKVYGGEIIGAGGRNSDYMYVHVIEG